MNNNNITRLRRVAPCRRTHKDLRLSNDDLHIINRALEPNRIMLAELRVEIREKVYFEGATLQDLQKNQHLFDRNEVFSLLGDQYVLDQSQIDEGANILARWRTQPGEADSLNLSQTIELLAQLLELSNAALENAEELAILA